MTPILKSRALQESDFMRPGRTSGKGREPPSEPVPSVKFSPLDAPSEFTPAAVDRRHAPLLREFGIDIVEPLTRMALGDDFGLLDARHLISGKPGLAFDDRHLVAEHLDHRHVASERTLPSLDAKAVERRPRQQEWDADPAGTVDRGPDQLGQVETWCGALQCPLQGVVAGREDPGMEPVVRAIHGHQHGDDSAVAHTQVSPAQPSLSAVHKARTRTFGQAAQVGGGSFPALPSALCEIARRGAKTLAGEDLFEAAKGALRLGTPHPIAAANLGRDRDAITAHAAAGVR